MISLSTLGNFRRRSSATSSRASCGGRDRDRASNGLVPAAASKRTDPSPQTSVASVRGAPVICSGAM